MALYFSMTRDINGYNGFGVQPPDVQYEFILEADAEQTLTIPESHSRWLAIFSIPSASNVWIANNETATYASGATPTLTNSAQNPPAFEVKGGDVLHFITEDTSVSMNVRLYVVNGMNL